MGGGSQLLFAATGAGSAAVAGEAGVVLELAPHADADKSTMRARPVRDMMFVSSWSRRSPKEVACLTFGKADPR